MTTTPASFLTSDVCWCDQRLGGGNPFLFHAMEWDVETGFYFGTARVRPPPVDPLPTGNARQGEGREEQRHGLQRQQSVTGGSPPR